MSSIDRFGRAAPLALVLACMWTPACHRDKPRTTPDEVRRCVAGVQTAIRVKTLDEATRIYYRECASVYFEPACRQAFTDAANESGDAERRAKVFGPCRTAYCPMLEGSGLEACQPSFQPTPANIVRAWPSLQEAILKYDAKIYAGQITLATVALYVRFMKQAGKPVAPPQPSDEPSARASAPAEAPAASASAPPVPAASR